MVGTTKMANFTSFWRRYKQSWTAAKASEQPSTRVAQLVMADGADDPPLTVDEILDLIASQNDEDKLDGLYELALLVDSAFGEQAALLGHAVREAGAIPVLGWLAVDANSSPDVQQQALLVLGNLCSDAADPNSHLSKAELLKAGGSGSMVLAIEQTDDASVLVYACGCLQNLCQDVNWAQALLVEDVHVRLTELLDHNDAKVRHYAAGTLRNVQLSLTSAGLEAPALSQRAENIVNRRQIDAALDVIKRKRALRIIRERVQFIPPEKRLERLLTQRFENSLSYQSPNAAKAKLNAAANTALLSVSSNISSGGTPAAAAASSTRP